MRRVLTALCLCAPLPAFADCADLSVMTCSLSGGAKTLQVCQAGDAVAYSFGPAGGAPELALTEPLASGTYTPWNGIGRAIWETVGFRSEGFTYEVWSSFDRLEETAQVEGGVNVYKGDDLQASLTCDPGSVEAGFDSLFPVMEAQGFCWNRDTYAWQRGGCG